MLKRGSSGTIACLLLALSACPFAAAQDAETLLREGHDLYMRGRDDEALQKMKAVIALDPSSADAFRLINALEPRVWASLMLKGGEHDAVVRTLMRVAIPGERAHQRDATRIRDLARQLEEGSWPERQRAITQLMADHGEYAAAYLSTRLGSADTERRALNMNWLRMMGTESVQPLIQALESDAALVQAGAATVLGQLGAIQAKPFLAALAASDAEPLAREAASKALAEIGGARPAPVEGLVALADAYYRGDHRYVDPFRRNTTVWAFEDGALAGRDVPSDVYPLKLAEEALYDALALDPAANSAAELLGCVLLAQAVVAEGSDAEEAAPLAAARDLAEALGPAVLNGALRKALRDGRPEVATAAVNSLRSIPGGAKLGGVAEALASDAKAVRIAAALALAAAGETTPQVVAALAEGVAQDSVRSILVVDDQAATRNQIVSDLASRGYFPVGVRTGPEGLSQLGTYPTEDAVVIRYNMADSTAAELVRMIRRDGARTRDLPVALLVDAAEMDQARELFADRVQLFIATPPVADAYEPELRALVRPVDAAREEAIELASSSATMLAHMDPASARGAAGALQAALGGIEDRVRVPAAAALGRIGDGAAVEALLGILTDGSQSDQLRGQAAVALGRIARQSGSAPANVVDAVRETLLGTDSRDLHRDLAVAAGLLPVDAATRAGLLKALRGRITVGSPGDRE